MNFLKIILVMAFASIGSVTKITMPTDYSSVASGTRANLKANFDETQTRFNAAADSIDEVRGRMSGYTGEFTLSSLDNLRLRLDTDGSSVARFYVANGYAGDTLFRVAEDSTWKFWGSGTGSKLTLSDSILAATARISGLTASRLMATNTDKTLASVSDLTSWIAGTSNQITSTSDGDGSITLSIPNGFTLPSASPTFTGLTLSGNATVGGTLGVTGATTLGGTVRLNNANNLQWLNASATTRNILALNASNNLEVNGTGDGGINFFVGTGNNGGTVSSAGAWSLPSTLVVSGNLTLSTISSGRIPVVSAAGLITQDNLYWDATNDRLGIGSGASSPSYGLHVAGTMGVTGAVTFTAAPTFSSVTASEFLLTDGSKALTSVAGTGSGSVVRATSPTIASPTFSGTITTPLTASLPVFTNGSSQLTTNAVTGTGNVMMSASPTTTGTLTGAAANFSGAVTSSTLQAGGGEAFTAGDTSFTLTATGMTTSPTGTAYATRFGNIVVLYIPYITGTSNSGNFTLTGLPSALTPTRTQAVRFTSYVDGGSPMGDGGHLYVQTSGVIALGTNAPPGFWNSAGTKAIGVASGTIGTTITYLLQ